MSISTILSIDGDTIYVDSAGRRHLSLNDALESERGSPGFIPSRKNVVSDEEMEWVKIVRAAKNNPGLADLLDRAKEFYILGSN